MLNFARLVGDREEIQKLSDRLVEKDPGNLQIHSMRFDQAYDAGDVPSMEKILQEIERVEGKGPVWLRGQAWLRSHKVFAGGNPALLDESLELLEQAKDIRPNWSKIPLMMGQIIDQKKDPLLRAEILSRCHRPGRLPPPRRVARGADSLQAATL